MRALVFQRLVVRILAAAIISLGYVQVSSAGVVGTAQVIGSEARSQQLSRIEIVLARQDVADQLLRFGVAPEAVMERVQYLSDAEVATLADSLDRQIAGEGLLEVVGIVFVVLLVLELVGVIDIFKKV